MTDVGDAVASWLVRWTPEPAVRVRVLAGDIVLCSWTRLFTLTVPLSTQVHKCISCCWGNLSNCGEVTGDGLAFRPGEVEILLAASCYGNRGKLRQLWASWIQGFTCLMTGPEESSEFCFPRISMFLSTVSRETLRFWGKQNSLFPLGPPTVVNISRSLPAHGIWWETVLYFDVMWPWTRRWMGAL